MLHNWEAAFRAYPTESMRHIDPRLVQQGLESFRTENDYRYRVVLIVHDPYDFLGCVQLLHPDGSLVGDAFVLDIQGDMSIVNCLSREAVEWMD